MLKKNEKLFKSTRLSSLLLLLFLFLLPLLLLPSPLRSDDWLNGFKDLTHTGTSNDSITPPFNLKWKYKSAGTYRGTSYVLPGFGLAAYSDDKLQITWTSCCRHYGYDIKNNNMLWHYDDGIIRYSSDYYPSICGNKVFCGMGHNGLYNFDTTLGSIIFSTGGVGGEAGGAVNYNGLIYIIRQSDDMRMQSVECRDPFTGGIKWSRSNQNEYFAGYDFRLRTSTETGTGGNFEMTVPCIAEDTVFIQFMGEIHAMDSRTGVSKWKINLCELFSIGINGLLHNAYGYTGSVAYENGKIYCAGLKGKSPDTMSMYCLDAKTGQEVWRYEVYT